jgi:hypothetical protein
MGEAKQVGGNIACGRKICFDAGWKTQRPGSRSATRRSGDRSKPVAVGQSIEFKFSQWVRPRAAHFGAEDETRVAGRGQV